MGDSTAERQLGHRQGGVEPSQDTEQVRGLREISTRALSTDSCAIPDGKLNNPSKLAFPHRRETAFTAQ